MSENHPSVTRSEIIERLICKLPHIDANIIETSVKALLDEMSNSLSMGKRVEVRGFGSFALSEQRSRQARNPKTGETVFVETRLIPRFKAGKLLRTEVDQSVNN